METLKQLPADVQCMVLHRASITRQLAPLHCLPVEMCPPSAMLYIDRILSVRRHAVRINRQCVEERMRSGLDFYDAVGCEEVTNFHWTLDDDWEEYRDWVNSIQGSVVYDEMDPSSEQPVG